MNNQDGDTTVQSYRFLVPVAVYICRAEGAILQVATCMSSFVVPHRYTDYLQPRPARHGSSPRSRSIETFSCEFERALRVIWAYWKSACQAQREQKCVVRSATPPHGAAVRSGRSRLVENVKELGSGPTKSFSCRCFFVASRQSG